MARREPDHNARFNPKAFAARAGVALLGGAAVWLLGWGILATFAPEATRPWHTVWGLAGVSFVVSFAVPLPGLTSALLFSVRTPLALAAMGVLGAAAGGTLGAALIFAGGQAARPALRRRAEKSWWSRAVLRASNALVNRFTYLGVTFLICLPFIPRAPVLYAASTIELKARLLLGCVLGGTLARNSIIVLGLARVPW